MKKPKLGISVDKDPGTSICKSGTNQRTYSSSYLKDHLSQVYLSSSRSIMIGLSSLDPDAPPFWTHEVNRWYFCQKRVMDIPL